MWWRQSSETVKKSIKSEREGKDKGQSGSRKEGGETAEMQQLESLQQKDEGRDREREKRER